MLLNSFNYKNKMDFVILLKDLLMEEES